MMGFPLGHVEVDENARDLDVDTVLSCLARYVAGDWGDVSNSERASLDRVLADDRRESSLFGFYRLDDAGYFLSISTKPDRSRTRLAILWRRQDPLFEYGAFAASG